MDPIRDYLRDDTLPNDKKTAHQIRVKAAHFHLSPEGKLYKRSFTGPYLQCVHPKDVEQVLHELHEVVCGSHIGGRSLTFRVMKEGYWWPYMQKDSAMYAQKCEKCQLHTPMVHQPASELRSLTSPWPFAQWGMDIVGPLPTAAGNRKYLLVATDYFTKWIEAEPLANIRDADMIRFIWRNIITRFGIPRTIITDNGT